MFDRRHVLTGIGALPLAATIPLGAAAQTAGAPATPPIIFVHGNGDSEALWVTTLWRFESNGYPRNRLFAFNFTDPLARDDDNVAQPNRSSTGDQLRELTATIDRVMRATGAPKVAFVASSRGGYCVRSYLAEPGRAKNASHAVLCGVPNHGVFATAANPGSEFNGDGPFLKRLNAEESEVVPGVAFLTLRSDGMDKYAQPDGRFIGKPGVPTGVTFEGPALRGATNLVLGALDHRELAFHPRAFREIYKFIAGREPDKLAIVSDAPVNLGGLVTGLVGAVPTNRPVAGAHVEIFRVSPERGERIGHSVRRDTGADGRWGPIHVQPDWFLEFVLTVPGSPVTHTYRSPFPRSSDIVDLRPYHPLDKADAAAGAVVVLSRPRGYFGLPRDVVLLDGHEPTDVKHGVPTDSVSTLRLPAGAARTVAGDFNEERIVGRPWPTAENRVTVLELTG